MSYSPLNIFRLTVAVLASVICSCNGETEFHPLNQEEKTRTENSMKAHLKAGAEFRNNADFESAVEEHKLALADAEAIRDTLNIVVAMNQIGTDYRRLGILEEASSWHYEALRINAQYADSTSFQARKNNANAYNGLGNIMLTFEDYAGAEQVFRKALAVEEMLESELGQAINTSNIASIYEHEGKYELAMSWYERSIEHNRKANSILGVSLCHTSFGRIAEKQGRLDRARSEYNNAYDILKDNDPWHWLEPCFALAGLEIEEGNWSSAYLYINEGLNVANSINSLEHKMKGYDMLARYYEKRGDWHSALECYKLANETGDSLNSQSARTRLQDLRVEFEHDKVENEVNRLNRERELEKKRLHYTIMFAVLIVMLALGAIAVLALAVYFKNRSAKAMKELEKTREAFFTNVTHEFRTPLTVILGLSNKLKEKYAKDDNSEEEFSSLISQGNNLLDLVNQLLDVAKVQSSIGEPRWRTGDLDLMLNMEVDTMRAYGSQNLIDIKYVCNAAHLMVDFVPDYMKKVLDNLISNAIKFTQRGGHVYVTLDQEGKNAKITVHDNGLGIKEADLPHIFDSFYRGDTSSTIHGSGVGLNMSRQMIEAMDGRIEVESTVGEGTTFIVYLPLRHGSSIFDRWLPDSSRQQLVPVVGSCTHDENTPTILIVEDNDDIARYEASLLEDKFNIMYARNGQEALEKANEYMPDIIVTDLMMPVMDGLSLCKKLRSSVEINHIPVIVISAKSSDEDRLEGYKAGADAFLGKPFHAEELFIMIEKSLQAKKLLRQQYSDAMKEGKEETVEMSEKNKEFLTSLNSVIYSKMADPDLSSDMVAQMLYISQRQLNRKVKMMTGLDTTSFIRKARMASARKLLTSTSLPISEIVFKCGLDSPSYFSKLYRQEYGETPSQTRKAQSPVKE